MRRLALTDRNDTTDAGHPPLVTILTAHPAPLLALALRARGIVVTVVDHPGACWSMPAPGLLLVEGESLSLDEVERLRELFDELQRRGIQMMLATAGLDRLDPEYVEGRSREARSDGKRLVE
jgi:hypothetical protein